ncbi:MAG: translation initiation factor IF-2 [Limisphaerales bacterium]
MPVRIYDLAKKLGIESKLVLAKAKELGMSAAKVPSSSLDKITAEFLEQKLAEIYPQAPSSEAAPTVAAAPVAPPAPITIISEPAPEPVVSTTPVEAEAGLVETPVAEAVEAVAPAPPAAPEAKVELPPSVKPAETPPPPPPVPPAPRLPRIGEKVGFVVLPAKPAPRPAPEKPSARGMGGAKTDFTRRGDIRSVRPGAAAAGAPSLPGQRLGQRSAQRAPAAAAAPKPGKFVPPTSGEIITLKPPIIVRDLAEQLKRKPFQLIADLMEVGVFANVNQSIEEEVAQKICAKYNYRFEVEKRERGGGAHTPVKKVELDIEDKPEDMKLRPPVVTIMGHVDHGKTSLLDVIRKANVAAGEAGGITQHIGAYTISFPHPERKHELQQITFLDTPGHAAFSAMRARGATVTDIVVLVVAANDGVMPQTLEALSHAQAAKVPILVAVNKCDHPNANPLKVRQQLQDRGLVPDDWGGETIFVDVSALTKQGVDKLLEMILLQADLLELKANPNRRAKGNVIESGLEPGGPTATVLVRKGTLRVGDVVICGPWWGKVRALISEEGTRQKEAGPSVAVKILGLNGIPEAGLEFSVLEDEKAARDLADQRTQEARTQSTETRAKVTLENLFATLDATQAKTLRVVVKADTQGSVEAIVEALKKIEGGEVTLEVIHSAVGTITESDVLLASASEAIILGFHTRIDADVADLAKREGAQIKLYAIIYELIDEVKEAMAGLLEPDVKEVVIGSAEVRKIFELSKGGNVAGCMVSSGRIVRGKARVLRRKGLIYQGIIQTLRRFQDEVNEVRAGMECGIRIEGFNEMQVGDAIECYTTEKTAPKAA